jgi:hypothetical protein
LAVTATNWLKNATANLWLRLEGEIEVLKRQGRKFYLKLNPLAALLFIAFLNLEFLPLQFSSLAPIGMCLTTMEPWLKSHAAVINVISGDMRLGGEPNTV